MCSLHYVRLGGGQRQKGLENISIPSSHYIRPPLLKRISSGNDKLKEAHNVYKFGEKNNIEN